VAGWPWPGGRGCGRVAVAVAGWPWPWFGGRGCGRVAVAVAGWPWPWFGGRVVGRGRCRMAVAGWPGSCLHVVAGWPWLAGWPGHGAMDYTYKLFEESRKRVGLGHRDPKFKFLC